MADTKFYKLLNLIQKGDKDNILSYAKEYPELLKKQASSDFSYDTPICILIKKQENELALELSKLNPDALKQYCNGYSSDNAITILIKNYNNFEFAYQLAQINKEIVNTSLINYLIEYTNLDEFAVKFSSLNPKVLDPNVNYPIEYAIKLRKTDLADKLIEILDEYNTNQTEHVDL
jgi:hypothetical protein